MPILTRAEAWLDFPALLVMLLLLDVDNIIFLSMLSSQLAEGEQRRIRRWGFAIALAARGVLVAGIEGLTTSGIVLLDLGGYVLGVLELVLLLGGGFLLYKSLLEIYDRMLGIERPSWKKTKPRRVLLAVLVLNLAFSVDSVIAVSVLTDDVGVISLAIGLSLGLVYTFQQRIARFLQRHPTVQTLAVAFLVVFGVFLVLEGLHHSIPKGFLYFALVFSLAVELINLYDRRTPQRRVSVSQPQRPDSP
jgi:predicted tellurium resistance membrane protein TerC